VENRIPHSQPRLNHCALNFTVDYLSAPACSCGICYPTLDHYQKTDWAMRIRIDYQRDGQLKINLTRVLIRANLNLKLTCVPTQLRAQSCWHA